MDLVSCERAEDGIAVVTINRPERRNALNLEVKSRIAEAIGRLSSDPAVRVVVLTGSGGYFVAGTDLAEMATPHWQPDRCSRCCVTARRS
jgi:enoyl-CoA hydratase/carnithine racemase